MSAELLVHPSVLRHRSLSMFTIATRLRQATGREIITHHGRMTLQQLPSAAKRKPGPLDGGDAA